MNTISRRRGTRSTSHRLADSAGHSFEALEQRALLNGSPAGSEFQVNTYTTSAQAVSSVATDADGDFVVTWYSGGQDGSGYGVYAQLYNADGVARGSEFRVNTYTLGDQFWPSSAMDADGDFVITWHSSLQDGSEYGIYAQRYNAIGVAQGNEFRANTYTTGSQWFSSVAMDAEGDFVIAWRSPDGSSYGVYAQRYNAVGIPQDAEFLVNTNTVHVQRDPAVAMDADGDFVVAWQSYLQDGSSMGIFAQRYSATGVADGSEFQVNTYTTNTQFNAGAAMDGDGNFVVVWSSSDNASFGVYAQRYNAAGVEQGTEFLVNTTTAFTQLFPAVAMDADGHFVVTWSSQVQDGSDYGVFAQQYDSTGDTVGGEFQVNTFTTGTQFVPAVAMDSGDFIVTWHSRDQDGSEWGIFAQRYSATSAPVTTASSFVFQTAPHHLRFTFDQNVSASLGTDDLTLENLTTMQTIPSGDLSVSYHTATNTATFTYTGLGAGLTGVLPDGNYRATLIAPGITNPGGTPLAVDHVFDFFFLNGDANHDGRVNLQDFNILAANFGQSPRDFTQGDFNYSGNVNLADFNILAGRFGQMLAGPGSTARGGLPISSGAQSSTIGTSSTGDSKNDPLDDLLA